MKKLLFTLIFLLGGSFLLSRYAQRSPAEGVVAPVRPIAAAITHWDLPEPSAPAVHLDSSTQATIQKTAQKPASEVEIGSTPEEVAQNYLEHHREEWHLASYHEFRPSVLPSPTGTTVHFDVFQDGVPILHSSIDIRVNPDLTIASVKNDYKPIGEVDLSEMNGISEDDILQRYGNQYAFDPQSEDLSPVIVGSAPSAPAAAGQIAYAVAVHYVARPDQHVTLFVRSQDGAIVDQEISRAPSADSTSVP